MREWVEALVLGAVQGVTEFLPISSDGHLAITQQAFAWMSGTSHTGAENLFFDVMLHLGTLSAIVIYYRAVVLTGLKGLQGSEEVAPAYRRGAVIRTGLLAGVATAPLVPLALFFMTWIKHAFESTTATGVGFLITAAALLITARLQGRGEGGKGPAETSWLDALLIGLAQMFAPLPGVSRSGLTVAAALALGFSRSWAVGFSLLIAIPAILGAALKELKDVDPATLAGDRVAQTVAAAALAGVVGYGAIIWLVKIVRSGKMWYFSVYLLVLGTVVLLAAAGALRAPGKVLGDSADAGHETVVDGSAGSGDPRTSSGVVEKRQGGFMGGAEPALSDAVVSGAGQESVAGADASSLVLGGSLAGRP